jgi:hypothetical protein
MHFGEYELSPSLISLSLLPTGHPRTFQRSPVRTSTVCYHSFILPMGRSQGFAYNSTNSVALFRLAFASAAPLSGLTLLVKLTRRFIMQKARRHSINERMVSGSISSFYSKCFSPFLHSTSSLSVSQEYLVLADGPAGFEQGFTCPALLRILLVINTLHIQDYHPLWFFFPENSIWY